ncbi:MAG TPA: CBS domain-containing protein [Nitrososphaerales archaeon]|nr:CBS domain-containing protein [Nitrososphaerales archaeon]
MKASELKVLPVTDLMTPATTMSPMDTTSRVVGQMVRSKLYEVFIEEPDRTAIVTIRDVLNVRNIATTKLYTLMYYVPRLNPNNRVGDAATLMFEHRIRSLPIYRGPKLIGQITSQSIVEKLLEPKIGLKASAIMTSNPICLDAHDNVSKARQTMIRRKIDQLPVLREGKLDSVVTSEAIVSNILPPVDRTIKGDWRAGRFDVPVEDFANPDIVTNDASDDLRTVFDNMRKGSANYSIIENFGEVQGIVTYRDFMRLLLKAREEEQLPMMYIIGLPEDPFEAEAARQKFQRVVQLLRRGFPMMTEARAVIKAGETKAARKKYRVQLFIMSPYWHHSYSVFGYELPDAFDYIENWAKKLISRYQVRYSRVRSDSGFAPEIQQAPSSRGRAKGRTRATLR